jgi:hypothetical protein
VLFTADPDPSEVGGAVAFEGTSRRSPNAANRRLGAEVGGLSSLDCGAAAPGDWGFQVHKYVVDIGSSEAAYRTRSQSEDIVERTVDAFITSTGRRARKMLNGGNGYGSAGLQAFLFGRIRIRSETPSTQGSYNELLAARKPAGPQVRVSWEGHRRCERSGKDDGHSERGWEVHFFC